MEQLTGNEEFILHGCCTGITIKDFWCWSFSDLLNNTLRGIMAEFLVYSSLNKNTPRTQIRADWMPFDVTSPSGRRIEVKSAAYLQSWTTDFPSQIRFDIAKKFAWNGTTYASEAKRNCDLYVFCLFTALTRDVPILNLDYWEFYVMPTSALNKNVPNQKGISLSSLLKLKPIKTDYAGLMETIESIKL